jgi:hypothetical protein
MERAHGTTDGDPDDNYQMNLGASRVGGADDNS